MTIEVRQMVIKSSVGASPAPPAAEREQAAWREQMRREILSECRAWIEDRLRRERER
jgi:hypothetical protein